MNSVKKIYSLFFKKHPRKSLSLLVILLLAYFFCLPSPLFDDPTCMVLEDNRGNLLGARIAADGQWRFPHSDTIPNKFVQAITEFEDRRFFSHFGIDPKGIGRAIKQNVANKRIVSGGSTITMQVIRMARKGKKRTVFQKFMEAIMATRLELSYSKDNIMAHYASNAPFGGNVVGLDAASWRYFGKRPDLLSWSEAATLAVLPNSPALIHPGRNRKALQAKRNRLLDRLLENGHLDSLTCELAKEEPLPKKPLPLPRLAPHLLDRAYLEHFRGKKGKRTRLKSTIDRSLQEQASQIVERHQINLKANDIHNLAAVIIEVASGNVVAYVGNSPNAGKAHQAQVDVIKAPRSTGSILKPFLFASMLQEGSLLPNSLVADIPTSLSGYRPKNFYEKYDGVVSARRALIRSLNVPIIRMLQKYGLEKFHFQLQRLGLSSINKPASYYGLPLVLGGAEASLWDISSAYNSMSRTLNEYYENDSRYNPASFRKANYIFNRKTPSIKRTQLLEEAPVLSASAIWLTFDAMQEVERPNSEGDWEFFNSSKRIAWKTGTSFGFRDAWAVGTTPKYTIGVWAGNADGEGRPGLVGVKAAAPVLFDLFDLVPSSNWFDPPYDELVELPICKKSGNRASPNCKADTLLVQAAGINAPTCSFHKKIHLDSSQQWQVTSDCESPMDMIHQNWFVLPPVEEHYFKSKNPNYKLLPSYRADCLSFLDNKSHRPMQLIYPKEPTKIYVPLSLDGSVSRTVFKVAHRQNSMQVHWHLDNEFIGTTKDFHHYEFKPSVGHHTLTLVDEQGNRLEQVFEIIEKEKEH